MNILVSFDKKLMETFARLRNEFKRKGYTEEMLETLERNGILFLLEDKDGIAVIDNDYYVAKIKGLYEKFEKDYSEIRERLS